MNAPVPSDSPLNTDAMDVCEACEGAGKVEWSFHPNDPEPFEKTCVHCSGTGYIVREPEPVGSFENCGEMGPCCPRQAGGSMQEQVPSAAGEARAGTPAALPSNTVNTLRARFDTHGNFGRAHVEALFNEIVSQQRALTETHDAWTAETERRVHLQQELYQLRNERDNLRDHAHEHATRPALEPRASLRPDGMPEPSLEVLRRVAQQLEREWAGLSRKLEGSQTEVLQLEEAIRLMNEQRAGHEPRAELSAPIDGPFEVWFKPKDGTRGIMDDRNGIALTVHGFVDDAECKKYCEELANTLNGRTSQPPGDARLLERITTAICHLACDDPAQARKVLQSAIDGSPVLPSYRCNVNPEASPNARD